MQQLSQDTNIILLTMFRNLDYPWHGVEGSTKNLKSADFNTIHSQELLLLC